MPSPSPRTTCVRAYAPAKINLGLFVGPSREVDDRHELVSVMQSISLADELTLEPIQPDDRDADADEIVCPGVSGAPAENLAAVALRLFRAEVAWGAPPLRLRIAKRIPVAAGLGGGSADAAATLRLAHRLSGLGSPELLRELGARLGADVPAQVLPGRWLATGAGERLRELSPPSHSYGILVLPQADELAAGAVYRRFDEHLRGRSPEPRSHADLHELERRLQAAYELGVPAAAARELLHNDLQAAAISLCPPIERALAEALDVGADVAFVSGSGPTVVGLFLRANGPNRARRAVDGLAGRAPAAICATPVDEAFARAHDVPVRNNPRR
jgi:4-diphosphocytidyl-2-C-methyl-D-erythritol kinase